ncbi:hypothetical protein ACJMK2_010267 [Sinanodonta woodiana]|uniref:Uncharacterized protein n=1 Tax=Sinanodonta woodiana TaxID=1069815 RepID=A0ABD3VET0_SINWO
MNAVLGYLLGIFVLCHITTVHLFLCDTRLDYNSFECDSGTCCTPEDKVVKDTAVSNWNWVLCFFWLGGFRMFMESPNRVCANVSGRCKVTLNYCYLKGVTESTENYFSSTTPKTKKVKVSSAVGVIVGVYVAVLVLTIFGVFIVLVIRIRRKRTQKHITEATSKRANTFSNRGYNMNGGYEHSHECLTAISSPTLPSDYVSTDITYSEVETVTMAKDTEQIHILEFGNYYNDRTVQCTDSNEENAYDSTGLQTNHAVIEDTYDHTVSVVNNHAVTDDTYDHTVSVVNNQTVTDDTYDHAVSVYNNHAVIDDTYDHNFSPIVNSHAVIDI